MKYLKGFFSWFTTLRVARCLLGIEHLFIGGAVIHTVFVLTGGWGWWAPLGVLVLIILLEWWAVNSCDNDGYAFYSMALPHDDDSPKACSAAEAREAMEQAAEASEEALAERDQGIEEWQRRKNTVSNYAPWHHDIDGPWDGTNPRSVIKAHRHDD